MMKTVLGSAYLIWLEVKRRIIGTKNAAEVDVTDNCNLRCKHCYHFHDDNHKNFREAPIEIWKEKFTELYKSGIRFILLVGGEPALRQDILMLADSIFPFIYVITNGTIKIPKEFNHRLFVSMDGTESTNDVIRGNGVFSKIINNYSGDKRVVINMTLTKDNYHELEDVVKVSMINGFGGVVCNVYTHAIGDKDERVISDKERKFIIAEMRRVKSLYPNDLLLSKSMIKWYEYPDHRNSCYWGRSALHFDSSWNIRKCFSNNADCSECGCLAGSFQSYFRLLLHPHEMSRIGIIQTKN